MSRIDTTSNAEMYLRGASLGTQQFGLLANLAQEKIQNERNARLDASALEQRGIDNARNVRRDGMDMLQTIHGFRMDRSRLTLAQQEEKRRAAAFALEQEDRKRTMETRGALAKVLAGSLRDQLDTTRQAQQEAYTEQVMLQGGGRGVGGGVGGLGGAIAAGGTGAAMNPVGLSMAGRTERPMAGVHSTLGRDGLAGRTSAGDGREVKREGTFSSMFRVDHRADPVDQQYETAIGMAEATGNVEMLQALSELADDKTKRVAAFQRGVLLKRFPVEMITDPKDQALAKIAIASEDYKLLAQVAKSGRLDNLNGVTYEQFAQTVTTLSKGKATPAVIDALWTTQQMAQKSPSATADVVSYSREMAGEGRNAVGAIDQRIKIAQQDWQQAQKFKATLAGGRLGASEAQLKAAQDDIDEKAKTLNGLLDERDKAAGLPERDAPAENPGPELPEDAVLTMNGQTIAAKEIDPTQLLALWDEAQREWVRRNKRQPTEADRPAIIAIRDEFWKARSTP